MCTRSRCAHAAPAPLGNAGHARLDVGSTDRGLRLTVHADRGAEVELRELVDLERECCAFADWSVSLEEGKLVLEIDGNNDEAIAGVQRMFRGLSARQATG